MLETIKTKINDSPFISFEQYFQNYVMKIQDTNIDNEVAFLMRNNSLTTVLLNKVMNSEVKEYL